MKNIELTQGKFAIVDDSEFDNVNQFKWHYDKTTGYAKRSVTTNGVRKIVYMHRFINNTPDGMLTDHKNGDRLDNRKENLRSCNRTQNHANKRVGSNYSSNFKGVYWHKNRNKWVAMIRFERKGRYLGCYESEIEAAKAYNKAAKDLFGEFAKVNDLGEN